VRELIRWAFIPVVLGAALAPLTVVHAHNARLAGARTGRTAAAHLGWSAPGTRPGRIELSVSVGYGESFRTSAWVPVRVTAHNRTADTISGTIELPGASSPSGLETPPEPYRALYQTPLVLPAGVTKVVTLFIPGSSVGGSVRVQLLSGNSLYATSSDSPAAFDQASVSIGALSNDPANLTWLKRINTGTGAPVSLVRLTPATFDALPAALANFDVIVITDGSVSGLDGDQLSALEQYVSYGGSLLLIGGPGWQETLRPLPRALVPGTLMGTMTVPNLLGLSAIEPVTPPRHEVATSVSVLRDPRGTILAAERGVPLAVQDRDGAGQILYLAFDPTLDPIAQWQSARPVLNRLILRAAPAAAGRPARTQGEPDPTLFINPLSGPSNIGTELTNVRDAALTSIVLFSVLIVLSILVVGPANYLLLCRLRRQGLLWVTVPLSSLLCLGATLATTNHFKGNTVLVNTIGMVTLAGRSPARPAALYMGLFAPVPGDYHLTFDGQALPQYVPQFSDSGGIGTSPTRTPLGLRFQEGSNTEIQFLGMSMWSMRDVALHTTITVPGSVAGKLRIDRTGYLVGTVHNGTLLTLSHPIIIAGRSTIHLPDMPPGSTVGVRVKPYLSAADIGNQPFWNWVYGQPRFGGPVYVGGRWFFTDGPCCYGPSAPMEHTFDDRVSDAATQIPDAQTVILLGDVLFVAWNQQPMGTIRVDGASPQRRDLTMVVAPLTVHFQAGPFVLLSGTVGAHLVDISPRPGTSGCCGPAGPNSIDVAAGGSATFEFDLPSAGHLHFAHLRLNVDAGGAYGAESGHLWNWRARRWIRVDLSLGSAAVHDPDRFISSHGALLVKLVNSGGSGPNHGPDMRILDILRNLQISGDGVAA